MPSRGSPNNGDKIRIGYITPAFSGARHWVEWLHNPCLLGGPPTMGTKSEAATSPLPSWGARNWAEWRHLPSRGSPSNGDKIRSGYTTPNVSQVPKTGTPQSSYTSNSILGTVQKGTICGGKRPKKVRIVTKIGGGGCRGIRCIKSACVYVPLYCPYSRIITQTARRRISTPFALQ